MYKYLRVIFFMLLLPFVAQAQLNTDALNALLNDYVTSDDPGVVLYVNTPDGEWIGARGLANLETGTAIQADDLFRIGSATKPFVAALMLDLVENGDIALDARIADYLPANVVDNLANADSATVRQMLNMTSGIFDYLEGDEFWEQADANPSYAWTAAATVEAAFGYAPYFAPGSDYYYSNTNYNLAQMIIERITGNSLADTLETRIFAPLAMTSCFLEMPNRFAEGIVRGYADYGDGIEDVTTFNDGVGMGDGGIICNATDLARFLPALMTGELLDDETLTWMLETVADGDGGQYGLGIGYDETEFGRVAGHAGATSGFQSNMAYLESEGVTVVVLTNNFDAEIMEDLTDEALAIALGTF